MLKFKHFLSENKTENEITEAEGIALNVELKKHLSFAIRFFNGNVGAQFGTWCIEEYPNVIFFTPARATKFVEKLKALVEDSQGKFKKHNFKIEFSNYTHISRTEMKEVFEEITGLDMEIYLKEHRGHVLSKKTGIT